MNNRLRGVGKVFGFTFSQHYKSKATIIMLVLLLLASLLVLPISSLVTNKDVLSTNKIEKIYYRNTSGIDLSFDNIKKGYSNLTIEPTTQDYEQLKTTLTENENEIFIDVLFDDTLSAYCINAYSGKPETLMDVEMLMLSEQIRTAFSEARLAQIGLSEQQTDIITNGFSVNTYDQKTYSPDESKGLSVVDFSLGAIYCFIIYMLITLTSAYIIRSVVEEKSSKLVDLMLVSVDPLAIIVGKISAVICFIGLGIVGIFVSTTISFAVTSRFLDISFLSSVDGINVLGVIESVKAGTVLNFIFSALIAVASFAMVSGISGVCCTNEEDIQTGSAFVMILGMLCFFLSFILVFVGNGVAITVFSLIPFISLFMAPIGFAIGKIGVGVLIVSYIESIIVAIALALLTGRVYKALITHNGNRIKFKQLIKIVFGLKKGGAK